MKNRCVLVVLASSSLLALACEAPPRSEERVGAATLTKAAKPNPTPEPATRRRRARRTLAPSTRWRASPAISKTAAWKMCADQGLALVDFAPSAECAQGVGDVAVECCPPDPTPPAPEPPTECTALGTGTCADHDSLWEEIKAACTDRGLEISSIQFVPGCARGGVSADFVCCPPPPPPPARDLHEGGRGLPRTLRDRGRAPQRGGGPLPGRRPGPGGRDRAGRRVRQRRLQIGKRRMLPAQDRAGEVTATRLSAAYSPGGDSAQAFPGAALHRISATVRWRAL